MKNILIILIFFLSFYKSQSQNSVYELYKYQDTVQRKYDFNFIIRAVDLRNVNRITFYKNIPAQTDPYFIKEVYVTPFNNYYLIEDGQSDTFIQTYFFTFFSLFKDEYSQISNLTYKIFFNNGESQSYNIPKP